ncbi:DNA topoisomerase 1 [Endocarpon pusillum Z07020]|uniref:DNA topoisomerase I n=1 Tax=Endocarpon pusillum (strain Z07020 / HMAS-L-300199) TaxID=1263415 RepID=U1G8C0_ENDPU|nr:DNA topoisomerase 1 [Endocarpon pusillum Z07020]ERF73672.1 DNA topoisomerase 1 [Endocarpon pusillum Z07020]
MSSSDDEIPLSRKMNGSNGVRAPVSAKTIPKSVDAALDKANPSKDHVQPGISIRNGPMEDHDHHMPDVNGVEINGSTSKRKSRGSLAKPSYAEAESSDEDNQPLSKRQRTSAQKAGDIAESDSDDVPLVSKSHIRRPPRASPAQIGGLSDSDAPIEQKLVAEKEKIQKKAAKEAVAIRKEEKKAASTPAKRKAKVKDEDGKGPDAAKAQKKSAPKIAGSKKVNGVKKEDLSDDDVPLSKKSTSSKTSKKVKAEASTPVKKGSKGKEAKKEESADAEEDEEEEYRWWEDPAKGDGTKKWDTLQHQGVIFPPPYEPLPKNVKMLYDGKPISMHPDAEEVATFFGSMLNSTHNVENPTFQRNFFKDFQDILKKTGGAKDNSGEKVAIKDFAKCDFRPIYDYYAAQREAKKALPAAEKKKLKAEKDAVEAPYMYCTWDGRKQKVGNFRVEPPGLFRGRGEHPKTGTVKTRVMPEQITINIGKEAKVPPPPEGHKWKEVRHDQEGTWLAMWQENVNGNYKYVMLAANSDVKGQSDYKKFEKARELKKHIDRIRADYQKGLRAALTSDRQKATAVYLIDQFALRAGNEKGEDEADTVGCCSLKFEHVTLREPNTVIFDFLGKDSIRFYDEVKVDPQVFKNLKLFKKPPKEEGDEIFDRLTTSALNKHLSNYMTGLTAKVFRTYNASYTMATLLKDMKSTGTANEKVKDYNDANREVAILCNHKRTVAAGHAGQMEKLSERIKGVRYQQWRIKQMMLDIDPKLKKKKGAEYFELPQDLDEEWIHEHQAYLVDEQKSKITKKFEKDNEKLRAEGEREMKAKELEEKLEPARELEKKFKKENKTKKVEAEGKGPTIEKMEAKLTQLDQRLANMSLQAEDKENNKEVALGTSKINYIDPRLTVVFSKKFNVPIEKFFSKTLREKFDWAIKSVDEKWEF